MGIRKWARQRKILGLSLELSFYKTYHWNSLPRIPSVWLICVANGELSLKNRACLELSLTGETLDAQDVFLLRKDF